MIGYLFSVPFILYFYRALFPDETPARLSHFFPAAAGVLSLLVLSGLGRRAAIMPVAHGISILAILFAMVILFRALMQKRQSSLLLFSGSVILYLCAVNDILNELRLIDTVVLMRMGLLAFILCQSWALALRFSKAFATSEKLFAEVQEKNIALSKLNRLKDEFLATTSHELRTPLNGIIGITEALLDGAAGQISDKARANLRMVDHSGRRLARLVDEILDFARLKNSDVTLVMRAVDLRASATAVTSVLERTLDGRDVAFEIHIPESLPPVLGDEDRIQQILYNLLGNAAKFTEKGRIVLSAEMSGEMVSVSVADTGSGIAEDRLETIFEPFDQSGVTAGGVRGTGLGLSITENLVRLHGGRIRADSAPGRGARFTFTLPLAGVDTPAATLPPAGTREDEDLPAAVAPAALPPVLEPAAPGGYRVLVVDDDPINLQVAANHLTAAGHGVWTAVDGADALEIIRSEEKPDLVLLDIIMPGMSGHEVCRAIRENHAPPALPVVMLTAAGHTESLVAGFAAGANDYLTKPFSGQELTVRVNAQLQLKTAFETLAENVRLKRELTRRKETQQHLLLTQRRLSELLNTVGDALLAINEDHEVTFCNRACRGLLGYPAEVLLGRPVRTVAANKTAARLEAILEEREETFNNNWIPEMVFTRVDGGSLTADVLIASLDLDDEQLSVILIRAAAASPHGQHPALPLISELNRHQQRLRTIEESLAAALHPETPLIRQGIEAVDAALDSVRQALQLPEKEADKSILAGYVMNLSIDYWIESTGMDKFDLARQSGQWRVYTNADGWERAQTLDKYLNADTLPKKPRWKQVLATAEFVLTFCEAPSDLRTRLEAFLLDLRKACR